MYQKIKIPESLGRKGAEEIRCALGLVGVSGVLEGYISQEGDILDFRREQDDVIPFWLSREFRVALRAAINPAWMARSLGNDTFILPSEGKDEVALNGAIRYYIRRLIAECRKTKSVRFAENAYREAEKALGLLKTQKTVHSTREMDEAQKIFLEFGEALGHLAHRLPENLKIIVWKAWAFSKAQRLEAPLSTPGGEITVGIFREAKDPRWYPFFRKDIERRADYYILAGTLTAKGSTLTAHPIYDEGGFWGVEVCWRTRHATIFAWEIKVSDERWPEFSLVRKDPKKMLPEEIRQGDVFFSPGRNNFPGLYREDNLPDMIEACRFDPEPVQCLWGGEEGGILRFPPGTVLIMHPDHQSVRIEPVNGEVHFRSVGGWNNFYPPNRKGD